MNYPFPTAADDERYLELGIEPVHYSTHQMDAAATAWTELSAVPAQSETFVRLLAVRHGSVAEATVLWDALLHHLQNGLRQYTERSAHYYVQRYGQQMLSARSCSRAMANLVKAGMLVLWPQKKNVASRFRLDWVALHLAIAAMPTQSGRIPGLAAQVESNP